MYSPPMSAYEDATNAGSLSLISSDTLRRGLAEYRRLMEDDAREQEVARERFDTSMVPLWNEYVSSRDHFDVAKGPRSLPAPLEPIYPHQRRNRNGSPHRLDRSASRCEGRCSSSSSP